MIKTGGKDDSNHDYKTILKFDTDTLSWVQVGEMRQARAYHGVSIVNEADVMMFCVWKLDK